MANNKKVVAALSTAAITGLITTALGSTAFAKTTDVLVGNGGTNYKYSLSELNQSYADNKMGSDALLYKDYASKLAGGNVVGLYDDKQNAYVDYSKVAAAFADAKVIGTTTFDLNNFTETSKDTIATPSAIKAVTVKDGKVVVSEPTGKLSVSSVSAITKTKVEVTFSTAVDAAAKENFSIDGVTVTGATLSSDRTKVDLDITGADWDTSYTVKATGLKVAGTAQGDLTGTFKTLSVNDAYSLSVTADDSTVTADAAHTTTVRAKLIDKATGKAATDADGMVIQFSASAGNLANSRVTVQNGEADVTFVSETETSAVVAKIDAQINEAQGDYKPLIGKVFGTTNILLSPAGISSTSAIITGAQSDVADRVTLHFNGDLAVKDFVKQNPDGSYMVQPKGTIDPTDGNLIEGNAIPWTSTDKTGYGIKITQPGTNKLFKVRGFEPVKGDSKAMVVILDKNTTLTDNKEVDVTLTNFAVSNSSVNSNQSFVLTDPRPAEATSVSAEGLKKLHVTFSEPIETKDIDWNQVVIDAGKVNANLDATSTLTTGDFDQNKFTDERNVLTVGFGTYKQDVLASDGTILHYGAVANPNHVRTAAEATHFTSYGADQYYISSGNHTVQLSSIKDYAGLTDEKNISTTQTLQFAVAANDVVPAVASITAQSPEQFDVKFNCDVDQTTLLSSGISIWGMNAAGKYVALGGTAIKLDSVNYLQDPGVNIQKVSDSEYIVQLNKDWTQVYQTSITNKNYYNGKYALHFGQDALVNPSNGKTSGDPFEAAITGDAISKPDVTSPVISDIALDPNDITHNTFNVTMSEPVKLAGPTGAVITPDDPNDTRSETQGTLQTTSAYLLGTDSKGNTVTVDANIVAYTNMSDSKCDTVFKVVAKPVGSPAKTIQQLVNNGTYGTNWTVVVKSISDDAGNTASTLTKAFTLNKDVKQTGFYATNTAIDLDGKLPDKVFVTFSDTVTITGNVENATDASNYTLDGNTLPVGTSITLTNDIGPDDGIADNTICISLPDGYLTKSNEHTLVVAKSLKSASGVLYDTAHSVQLQLPSINGAVQDAIGNHLTAGTSVSVKDNQIALATTTPTANVVDLVGNIISDPLIKDVNSISIDNVTVGINGSLDSAKIAQIKSALNLTANPTYAGLQTYLAGKTVTLNIDGANYTVVLK